MKNIIKFSFHCLEGLILTCFCNQKPTRMGNSVKTAFIITFIVWASSLYVSKSGKGIEIVPNFCRLIIMAITKENNLNLPFT